MEKTIITENEIMNILMENNIGKSETNLKWKKFHYCKENGLKNIGNQQYVKAKYVYDYELGIEANTVKEKIKEDYPNIKVAIWESRILNEWLNLLVAKNTIFIEVEKAFLETIYDKLSESNENRMILVNPKIDEFYRYQKDELIVLRNMVERAPVSKDGQITLEKLIVDLLCDKFLGKLFDGNMVCDLINNIRDTYAINEKKLLAYARRRGRYDEIFQYWRDK